MQKLFLTLLFSWSLFGQYKDPIAYTPHPDNEAFEESQSDEKATKPKIVSRHFIAGKDWLDLVAQLDNGDEVTYTKKANFPSACIYATKLSDNHEIREHASNEWHQFMDYYFKRLSKTIKWKYNDTNTTLF